jgi:hypothetical protein
MNYNRKIPMPVAVVMLVAVMLGAAFAGSTLSGRKPAIKIAAAGPVTPIDPAFCNPACNCYYTISYECCQECGFTGRYCKAFIKQCGSQQEYCFGCLCGS